MTQPLLSFIVSDLCGKRVHVTRDRYDRDTFGPTRHTTEIKATGVVQSIAYVQGYYTFLLSVERELEIDGIKKVWPVLEAYYLGDGTGIVLVDPPGVQYGRSLDEIAPHLTIEDTSRPCPKCGARIGSRCFGSRGPVVEGYMHSERGSAT